MTDMTETSRHKTIARRAYELWEHEGRPDGQEKEHWSRAEAEIGSDGSDPDGPEPQGMPGDADTAAATMAAEAGRGAVAVPGRAEAARPAAGHGAEEEPALIHR